MINNRDEIVKPMANSLAQLYKNVKGVIHVGHLNPT